MTPETFTCASCNETFEKARTDEEAMADAETFFTAEALADNPAVVCGTCWEAQLEVAGGRPMPEGLDPVLWNLVMRMTAIQIANEIMGPRQ